MTDVNHHSTAGTQGKKSGVPSGTAPGVSRRGFLMQAAAAAASPVLGATAVEKRQVQAQKSFLSRAVKKPNILMVISDQYRWDFIGAAGRNPMGLTPNLDAMWRRGTAFQNAMTNQPLCSPARACLFTGQYATRTGVWKLQLGLRENAITLATLLGEAGYSTNYLGKWHLAPNPGQTGKGPVPARYRGGFTGLWLAANVPEISTQPYNSQFWDNDNKPVHYGRNTYRVDFLAGEAEKFLRERHAKPFLLVLSQLEPHQQNGQGFVAPRGVARRFRNPYTPPDLKALPGDWSATLNHYYGDCKAIDDSMGRIFQVLREEHLEENTIVMFLADHGCHFRTRNIEYKRSPHDASARIPLIVQGPGFDGGGTVTELVNIIDIAPTLLDAAGVDAPAFMQGHSLLPLVHDPAARAAWRNEVFIQISESETGRALRTPEWTYCAICDDVASLQHPSWRHYRDYQLYDNLADPAQVLNLCGRQDYPRITDIHYIGERSLPKITRTLRERLTARMVEAGEERPDIANWPFYP